MSGKLFTIGHSTFPQERLICRLKMHNVTHLLDVRSVPYSAFASQYNREELSALLIREGIKYSYMGMFFGARPSDPALYSDEGYLDFEKVRESVRFKTAVQNVIIGLQEGNSIALMCTEKMPIDCHRAILVARGFELAGVDVEHILPDGDVLTQSELDQLLLEMFFPNRNQLSLFEPLRSEEEYICDAYKERNREIGFRPDSVVKKAGGLQ